MATSENRTLSIQARLTDHVSKPASTINKALVGMGKGAATVFGGVSKSVFNLRSAIVGLAGAYVGLAAVAKVRALAESADEILRLAESTGDTVENLSELRAAFELNGGKAAQFADVLKQLGVQTKAAFSGNAEMIRSFRAIGISLDELRTLAPAQLFEQIATGLERFGTQQERALALSRLLPEQYLRLLPLLGKGTDAFREAVVQAREAGATVTRAEAVLADRLNDSLTKIQFAAEGVFRALVEQHGPAATVVLEKLAKVITENKGAIVEFTRAIGTGIVTGVNLAGDAIVGLIRLIEKIPGVNLIDDETTRRLEEVRRELQAFEDLAPQLRETNPAAFLRHSARKVELERELAELEARADRGLAGAIESARAEMRAQLEAAVAEIRASATPKTPEQTAALLGLPNGQDVEDYSDAIVGKLLKDIEAHTQDASVFAIPKVPAIDLGPAAATIDDMSASTRRLIQELALVAPELQGISDEMLEIERKQAVLELEAAAEAGLLNAEQLAAALAAVNQRFGDLKRRDEEMERSFKGGFYRAIKQVREEAEHFGETIGSSIGNVAVSGLEGLGDAFGEVIAGTKSAKDAFKDFARQFLVDIARMIGKLAALGAVKTIFGLEDGGVVLGGVDTNVPFRALAGGDVIRSPTLALIGEGEKNEAVVPLPDNRSIPVQFVGGGGGGGGPNITFNITAMDGKDVQRVLVEQQSTLRSIWENQAETRQGMRQVIQRTS